jgi:hypothetical protein
MLFPDTSQSVYKPREASPQKTRLRLQSASLRDCPPRAYE